MSSFQQITRKVHLVNFQVWTTFLCLRRLRKRVNNRKTFYISSFYWTTVVEDVVTGLKYPCIFLFLNTASLLSCPVTNALQLITRQPPQCFSLVSQPLLSKCAMNFLAFHFIQKEQQNTVASEITSLIDYFLFFFSVVHVILLKS